MKKFDPGRITAVDFMNRMIDFFTQKVAFDDESPIIRFDRGLVDRDRLSRFLDHINLETVCKKSPFWDHKIRGRVRGQ